jgi:hypothetical protein
MELPKEALTAAWSTACKNGLVIDVESDQSDLDDVVAAVAPALRKQGADQERQRLKEVLQSDEAVETMAEHFFKAVRRMSAGTSDRGREWAGLSPAEKTPYFGCAKQALFACR